MKLTRSQKMYSSVLGLCLAAFALDQTLLGPDEAGATETPMPVHPAPVVSPPGVGGNDEVRDFVIPEFTLASRLEEMAAEYELDPLQVEDAFRPSTSWLPERPVEEPVSTDDWESAAEAARFIERHRLSAVMANGRAGYAIVDGKRLRIGQQLDGYTLVEVGPRSATLEAHGRRIELTLPQPGHRGTSE